jgi:hypothetical protein
LVSFALVESITNLRLPVAETLPSLARGTPIPLLSSPLKAVASGFVFAIGEKLVNRSFQWVVT